MLNMYAAGPQGLARIDTPEDGSIPDTVVWLDLLEPTGDEGADLAAIRAFYQEGWAKHPAQF